jgi:hypothetical protein
MCAIGVVVLGSESVLAQNLLTNGNLDRVQDVEVVPGFFLPKPSSWQNVGSRLISGPYEDEMSSEPWAGPAPTPVTMDGLMNPPPYANPDYAVFFKAFSGNTTDGAATGHLYQDVPGTPGTMYTLTGWAGAEANFLARDAEFAIEFLDGGGGLIGGATLSLFPMLFVDNGQPFDYKQYTLSAVAPASTVLVRARASMLDGLANPAGGGQAFVVDDFTLIPAPSAGLGLLVINAAVVFGGRRRAKAPAH